MGRSGFAVSLAGVRCLVDMDKYKEMDIKMCCETVWRVV